MTLSPEVQQELLDWDLYLTDRGELVDRDTVRLLLSHNPALPETVQKVRHELLDKYGPINPYEVVIRGID